MTRLLLIRHGASEHQERGILTGWTPGIHLSQKGEAQAEALARRLAPLALAAIYASPLERALETAEIIAAPHHLSVVVRERLGEMIYGDWTGETMEHLERRPLWRAIQIAPSTVRFPGGESFIQMQARVIAEIEELCEHHARQTIAIVSHADVIKAAVAHYTGVHLDLFQRLVIHPGSLTVLELGGALPTLYCLNDTGHLPECQTSESAQERA